MAVDSRDTESRFEAAQRDTEAFEKALETLAWAEVTAREDRKLYVRSLLEDFAEGIGTSWQSPGPVAPLTARRAGGLLKNLAPAT